MGLSKISKIKYLCWTAASLLVIFSGILLLTKPKESSGVILSGEPLEHWLNNLEEHNCILPDNHPLVEIDEGIIPHLVNALDEDYSLGSISVKIKSIIKKQTISGSNFKETIAFRIGLFGPSATDAVPALIKLLDNPEKFSGDEGRVIQAIGNIGKPAKSAIPHLVKNLKDTKPWTQYTAAYSLIQIGDIPIEAIPLLEENLKYATNHRITMAMALLAANENQQNIDRVKQLFQESNEYGKINIASHLMYLEKIPDELVAVLLNALKSTNSLTKSASAIALSGTDTVAPDQMVSLLMKGVQMTMHKPIQFKHWGI